MALPEKTRSCEDTLSERNCNGFDKYIHRDIVWRKKGHSFVRENVTNRSKIDGQNDITKDNNEMEYPPNLVLCIGKVAADGNDIRKELPSYFSDSEEETTKDANVFDEYDSSTVSFNPSLSVMNDLPTITTNITRKTTVTSKYSKIQSVRRRRTFTNIKIKYDAT